MPSGHRNRALALVVAVSAVVFVVAFLAGRATGGDTEAATASPVRSIAPPPGGGEGVARLESVGKLPGLRATPAPSGDGGAADETAPAPTPEPVPETGPTPVPEPQPEPEPEPPVVF